MDRRRILKWMGAGVVAATGIDRTFKALQERQLAARTIHDQPHHFTRVQRPERRESGHEKIHINPNEPTFNRLRERGVFPREHKWAITASAEAFHNIGKSFVENPGTAELLDKEEVRVLVPANGVLLSPLDIAFQLAEGSHTLQRVHFTLTDIDAETYGVLDQYVGMLVNGCDNLSDLVVNIESHPELSQEIRHTSSDTPAKKRMTFTYHTADHRAVAITIDYEFKMSGEHFFRAQSAADADIYVLHDIDRTDGEPPSSKEAGDIYTLLSDTYSPRLRDKNHFVVLDSLTGQYRHATNSVGQTVVGSAAGDERYGCGQNHLDTNTPTQMGLDRPAQPGRRVEIAQLDTELVEYLQRHGGDASFRAYSRLVTPGDFSMGMFVDDGPFRQSMQHFAQLVHTTPNQRIKHLLQNAARETLRYFEQHVNDDVNDTEEERRRYVRARRSLLEPIINS